MGLPPAVGVLAIWSLQYGPPRRPITRHSTPKGREGFLNPPPPPSRHRLRDSLLDILRRLNSISIFSPSSAMTSQALRMDHPSLLSVATHAAAGPKTTFHMFLALSSRRIASVMLAWSRVGGANQLADLLAKHAAESVRLSLGVRSAMQQREKKILELVKYVGKLTHEANHLSDGNGKFLRDSNPGPKRARKGKKGRKSASDSSKASPAKKSSSDTKSVRGSGNWMAHFLRKPCGMSARQLAKAAKFKYARERLEADAQASFAQWWREARVQAPTT